MRAKAWFAWSALLTAFMSVTQSVAADPAMLERIEHQQAQPDRHEFDLPRDAGRKPYAAFTFLGIEAGMTVLDVGAYAGYTTEMLAAAVGPTGKVYAHNTQRVLERFAKGYYRRTMDERLADNRLPNVVEHIRSYDDLGLAGEVDAAFLGNLLHDFYHDEGRARTVSYLKQIATALKPDGVLGITDHVGLAGQDNAKLHRIEPAIARELLGEAGFEIIAESSLYANPDDAHTLMVYDEEIYRATDRFFFKARPSRPLNVAEKLALLGHPHTKMCSLDHAAAGLGKVGLVQFEKQPTAAEDQRESVALLKILAEALSDAGQLYIAFNPTRKWQVCQQKSPKYIYWRDYDFNWRLVSGSPKKYLKKTLAGLAPELKGTTAEAFVLYALGVVEQRLHGRKRGIARFEQAYPMLKDSGDPNGIIRHVLGPLIQHHFSDEGDEVLGQDYLNDYALVTKNHPSGKANYIPLIKVAPVYPLGAVRGRQTGYVVLEFTVTADGRVVDPVVIEDSPQGVFGEAAVAAARQFRYIPAVVDNKRVATTGVRNKITFQLGRR